MIERVNVEDLVCQVVALHHGGAATLTPPRLMESVLLADWRAAIENGRPLTETRWFHSRQGIRSDEVEAVIYSSQRLIIAERSDGPIVELRSGVRLNRVAPAEQLVLEHVASVLPEMEMIDFAKLSISIFPALASQPGEFVDLAGLAAEYVKEVRPKLLAAAR